MTHHILTAGPAKYEGESSTVLEFFQMPSHPAADRARGYHRFFFTEKGKKYASRTHAENGLCGIQEAVVLTAWDRSAELAQREALTLTLEDGDTVEVMGIKFTFQLPTSRWNEAKFIEIA